MRWVGTAILVVLVTQPAVAAEAMMSWPGFIRMAPSPRATVLDEIKRGAVVDVQSCDIAWCRVRYGRTVGYLTRGLLEETKLVGQAAVKDCFEAMDANRHDLRICQR